MSSPVLIGVIADSAARAVFTVFVVCAVGVVLALTGKINREGIAVLSTTLNYIFVPAILFNSFASGLSVGSFRFAWTLVVAGILCIPVSGAIAYALLWLAKPIKWFRVWFVFGQTFQNTVALPLVFVSTVCSTTQFFARDDEGRVIYSSPGNASFSPSPLYMDPNTCNLRGQLYVFLYIFVNGLLFWVIAYDVMPTGRRETEVVTSGSSGPTAAASGGARSHSGEVGGQEDSSLGSNKEKKNSDGEENDGNVAATGDVETGLRGDSPPSREVALEMGEVAVTPTAVHDGQENDMEAAVRRRNSPRSSTGERKRASSMTHPVPLLLGETGAQDGPDAVDKRAVMTRRKPRGDNEREEQEENQENENGDFFAGSFYGGPATMERERFENRGKWLDRITGLGITVPPSSSSRASRFGRGVYRVARRTIQLMVRPPILAQLVGMFIGFVAPVQTAFYGKDSVLRPVTSAIEIFAEGGVSMTNLSMSAGLGLKMKHTKVKHLLGGGDDPSAISRRTTLVFVLGRMIVIPGLLFLLTYLLSPLLPNDRLLHLVIYIEAMTPSANMVVVVPQILGNDRASDAMSLLVLSQYALALPTLLLWMTLAFYLTANVEVAS